MCTLTQGQISQPDLGPALSVQTCLLIASVPELGYCHWVCLAHLAHVRWDWALGAKAIASASLVTALGSLLTVPCRAAGSHHSLTQAWPVGPKGS